MFISTKLVHFCWLLCLPVLLCAQNDGTPDLTFGSSGSVTVGLPSYGGNGYHLLMPDGRIVLIGEIENPDSGDQDLFVARFQSNGDYDLSFGGGQGFVLIPIQPETFTDIDAHALTPDGKILVVISAYDYNTETEGTHIFRLQEDGSPDSTFAGNGHLDIDIAAGDAEEYLYDVAILPDGKMLFCGYISNAIGLPTAFFMRLNNDGTFDTSYDGDGKYSYPAGYLAHGIFSMEQLPDGKFAVAGLGFKASGASVAFLSRLGADGKPDPTFGTNGKAEINTTLDEIFFISDMKIQKDGKWVFYGEAADPNVSDGDHYFLIRTNPDGTLDAGFGQNGAITLDIGLYDESNQLALQEDGKILVAGTSYLLSGSRVVLARFTAAGILDSTFNNSGSILGDSLNAAYGMSTSVQPDGKVLFSGLTSVDGVSEFEFFINRYNSSIVGVGNPKKITASAQLSPNPAAGGFVNLAFELENPALFQVLLVDQAGKAVANLSNQTNWPQGKQQLQLALPSGLPAGQYLVVLLGKDGAESLPLIMTK